jgi:hypothetical protein
MDERQTDGPRPPHSPGVRPAKRVRRLVAFVHVEDVALSVAFYHHLGFAVESVYHYRVRPVWAALVSDDAELMVSTDGQSIDPDGQSVLFYLYSDDPVALRQQLLAAGIEAGESSMGRPDRRRASPRGP